MEKDPHDTSQKAKESQDSSHKILELQKKLDSARSQVRKIEKTNSVIVERLKRFCQKN